MNAVLEQLKGYASAYPKAATAVVLFVVVLAGISFFHFIQHFRKRRRLSTTVPERMGYPEEPGLILDVPRASFREDVMNRLATTTGTSVPARPPAPAQVTEVEDDLEPLAAAATPAPPPAAATSAAVMDEPEGAVDEDGADLSDVTRRVQQVQDEKRHGLRAVLDDFEGSADLAGIRQAEEMLAQDPDNERTLDWLAFMYYTNDMVEKAIELYVRLVAKRPEKADYLFYLGNCYYKSGLFSDAIETWERVLALDAPAKMKQKTKKSLAQVNELFGKWMEVGARVGAAEAAEHAEPAQSDEEQAEPEPVASGDGALSQVAADDLFARLRAENEAAATSVQAPTPAPTPAPVRSAPPAAAVPAAGSSAPAGAPGFMGSSIDEIERRLAEDPTNPELLDWLGFMCYTANDLAKASRIYLLLLQLDPENCSAYYHLGNTLFKMDRVRPAFAMWGHLIEKHPTSKFTPKARSRVDKVRALLLDDDSEDGASANPLFGLPDAKVVLAELEAEESARPTDAAQEEASRVAAEDEARRVAAEDEARRVAAEEEARRVAAEEEARRVAAEEEARRVAAEEEARRVAAEEEARRLAAEEEARRLAAEEEARRQAEEEARRQLEAEIRRKVEEEFREKARAEEEARRQAEEEARRQAEEEARRQAEEEARRQAEEEARRQAEEEARRLAAEEAEREAAAASTVAALELAFQEEPDNDELLLLLADAYFDEGRMDLAAEAYGDLVTRELVSDTILYRLGEARLAGGQAPEAMVAWDRLMREFPTSEFLDQALDGLIRAKSQGGSQATPGTAETPAPGPSFDFSGLASFFPGGFEASSPEAPPKAPVEEAPASDTGVATPSMDAARDEISPEEQAKQQKRRELILKDAFPEERAAWQSFVGELGGTGPEVTAKLEIYLERNLEGWAAWEFLAFCYQVQGQFAFAQRVLEHLLAQHPREARYHYYYGNILWFLKLREQAQDAWADAIKHDPGGPVGTKSMAKLAKMKKKSGL